MSRRKRLVLILIAVLLLPPIVLVAHLALLPRTPEGRFTRHTGLEYPSDAVVVEKVSNYTRGMSETFASEGTSVFAFRTGAEVVRRWVGAKPPWQEEWTRGEVPVWVNEKRPPGSNVYYTIRGDMADGCLLAIDCSTNIVWLFRWNW